MTYCCLAACSVEAWGMKTGGYLDLRFNKGFRTEITEQVGRVKGWRS